VVKVTLPPGPAGRHLMVRTSLPLSDVAVWDKGAWQHLGSGIRGNDLNALLRFKRGIAVNGGRIAINIQPPVALAPGAVTTTTAPPLPPGVTVTTAPMAFPPGVAPPPMVVPPGAAVQAPAVAPVPVDVGGNATFDIPLPDGIGADGVVFLKLVTDASMGIPGDAVLTLVEVVK
jgi:hypothetical protein